MSYLYNYNDFRDKLVEDKEKKKIPKWVKLMVPIFIVAYGLFGYFPEKINIESDVLEYIREETTYDHKTVVLEGYLMKSFIRDNYMAYTIQIGDHKLPLIDPNIVIAPRLKSNKVNETPKNTLIKIKTIQGKYYVENDILYSMIRYNYWNKEEGVFASEDLGKFYYDSTKDIMYILYNDLNDNAEDTNIKIAVTGSNLKEAEANVEYIFSKFE